MKQNKAEKLLAGVLSISLAMGVSVMPAFAAQAQDSPYEDMSRVYLTKNYELANTGTISPEETFTFAIEPGTVTDASDGIKAGDYMPIVGDVTYAQGEAGSASKTKKIEIKLPEYDSVGVYTYIIHEVAGNSAGVTYYGDAILLRVTVIEQDGKLRIAAVHTEDPESTGEGKKDDFDNLYSAGELEVHKDVEGDWHRGRSGCGGRAGKLHQHQGRHCGCRCGAGQRTLSLHPDGCCGRRAAVDPAPPPSEVSAEEIRQGR